MTSRKVLVLAVITEILDTNITYPSCVSCYSKLLIDPTTDRYHCVKCGTNCEKSKVQWRYRLVVCISDRTCVGRVVVFGRCLDGFFGKTATDFTRSLDDLEQTGYPAKSMLSEALLRTFLGKYFYFGFKVTSVCDTQGCSALKDVLNLDESLVHSQLDCTSNFDSYHTLVHQMLASSDAVFVSVTDHMRIMVKQLRTQRTVSVIGKTQVNPCDTKNQSNNDRSSLKGSHRTPGSVSLSCNTSFELGLDSVHFSFETNSSVARTKEKLGDNDNILKTEGFINQLSDSKYLMKDSIHEMSCFPEKPMVSSNTSSPAECLSCVTVNMFDDDNDIHVSDNDFNTENILHDQCETLSDLPVTQQLLFDSPSGCVDSNTSKKIDKELYRREILHSCAYTSEQFSYLSGISYFHQGTCNTTGNCKNSVLCTSRAIRECSSTFKHPCGVGFLHDRTTSDIKPLSSVSLLRNKLAAEFAMPESEDLNAFFDSEFDGIVFTQDDEDLDVTKADTSRHSCGVSENTSEIKHVYSALTESDSSDSHVKNLDETHSEMKDTTCQGDNAPGECLAAECSVGKIKNTHKPTIKHSSNLKRLVAEKSGETIKDCRLEDANTDISQWQCGSRDNFSQAENFLDSFEEHFFENEFNDMKTEAVVESSQVHTGDNDIDKLPSETIAGDTVEEKSKVDEDLEHFFEDISNYEIDKSQADNQNEKVTLFDNDLEEFFADISKYEVEENQNEHEEEVNMHDHKNVIKCFGEKVGLGLQDDNDSDEANWYDDGFMNSVADDLDINLDSLRVADTPENAEGEDDINSIDTRSNIDGERFKKDDDTDGRLLEDVHESDASFHFDFLTSSNLTERSPCSYKHITVPDKSTPFKSDSFNGVALNERKHNKVTQDSDKKCDSNPLIKPSMTDITEEGSMNIIVANSFDASNDLFESSGGVGSDNDSPDIYTAVDALVSDSLHDESVWRGSPLDASTPAADQCIIFDSLDYVVVESDSEIDVAEYSDGKKMVKFDRKLRRVSSCNFIDLKMRVNDSPLIRLDQNMLLKSCLKVPKNLNFLTSMKRSEDNQNDNRNVEMTTVKKCAAKLSKFDLENSGSWTDGIDSLHSDCDNASVDLFADSFKASEGDDDVCDNKKDLNDVIEHGRANAPATSPINVSFSEHWSDDVSDNLLLEAIDNIDNKENNSETKVAKFKVNKALPNQGENYKISALRKDAMKKHVMAGISFEENSWSPDIFESPNFVNDCGPKLRMNNIFDSCNSFVKKVDPMKCKMKVKEHYLERTRCTESNKKIRVLSNAQNHVLNCLVLNTPECDALSDTHNAQKDKQLENQSNNVIINSKENQSSFYSPDLFSNSVLDFDDDDDDVCDRSSDVLCKKLLF